MLFSYFFSATSNTSEAEKRTTRHQEVVTNFFVGALHVVKSKSAYHRFETLMSDYHFMKVDVGDMCHSQKQMPFLVEIMCSIIDDTIREHLIHPLQPTGLAPHFFITFDKATFNGITNQAILLCAVINGARRALLLDTTAVYSVEENCLEGGSGSDLVTLIQQQLLRSLPSSNMSYCVAAVADGQYQTRSFVDNLQNKCGIGRVQWDSAHLLDLIFKDARKKDSSIFIRRMQKRVALFDQKLGSGFGKAALKATESELEEKVGKFFLNITVSS